jgi:alkylhydroperoxidase family enzyme
MARVPYLTAETVNDPEGHLSGVTGWDRSNVLRARANSPAALAATMQQARWIRELLTLPARYRELAILQVGYSTQTAYEWAHHIEIGLASGLSEEDIRAIALESADAPTHFEEIDRSVLRAAREMTQDLTISDSTFDGLRRHLTAAQIVDLVGLVAFYNGGVRVMRALQIDLEPRLVGLVERFPFGGQSSLPIPTICSLPSSRLIE